MTANLLIAALSSVADKIDAEVRRIVRFGPKVDFTAGIESRNSGGYRINCRKTEGGRIVVTGMVLPPLTCSGRIINSSATERNTISYISEFVERIPHRMYTLFMAALLDGVTARIVTRGEETPHCGSEKPLFERVPK